MSTPDGEPMISADYETRERLVNWDAVAVAGDSEAMKVALKEYAVRLIREHGSDWELEFYRLVGQTRREAWDEFKTVKARK